MAETHGYLLARLARIGSKSEGPEYFLQLWDYAEVHVVKKVYPWQEEPELHKHLGKKVTILGDYKDGRIIFEGVKEYQGNGVSPEGKLELALELSTGQDDVIWIHPAGPAKPCHEEFDELTMLLRVKWPYRSIWESKCPTTQTYDFVIYEGKDKGRKEIWRWSNGKVFPAVVTPVSVTGGEFVDFAKETVQYPVGLVKEGVYTVEGVFVATGQTVDRVVDVRVGVSP